MLEDVVHGARQLARHPHKGRALLLKELEPLDDLEVGRGGALHRLEHGHFRRDFLRLRHQRLRNRRSNWILLLLTQLSGLL